MVAKAAPQLTIHQNEDNDVAIDISREVYAVPEEKIGEVSADVPANILSNRQRRGTEEGDDEEVALSLFDTEDSFQDEDPHLSAPAPSLPLAPEAPAADIPTYDELVSEDAVVEETEPEPAHVLTPDGYEYKTVRRVQYRYRQ